LLIRLRRFRFGILSGATLSSQSDGLVTALFRRG
jgi:hypothetical protein